jgi:hypothetical protein
MKIRRYRSQSSQRWDDDLESDSKEGKEVSKPTIPISRRKVLIGAAAAMAVAGLPLPALPVNPKLRALPRRRNNLKEELR